ncbi:MAG: hypothetical protein RR321_08310, partial [Acidaminococcaceae bacterium]
FTWARYHRLSFGEYILLCTISELIRNITPSELYFLHRSGRSYQSICSSRGIDWALIEDSSRYRYDHLHDMAYSDGLSLWEWSDSIDE